MNRIVCLGCQSSYYFICNIDVSSDPFYGYLHYYRLSYFWAQLLDSAHCTRPRLFLQNVQGIVGEVSWVSAVPWKKKKICISKYSYKIIWDWVLCMQSLPHWKGICVPIWPPPKKPHKIWSTSCYTPIKGGDWKIIASDK